MTSKAQLTAEKPQPAVPQYLAVRDRFAEGSTPARWRRARLPSSGNSRPGAAPRAGTIREALFQLEGGDDLPARPLGLVCPRHHPSPTIRRAGRAS